jgi:4-hydroxy-tetrahydrodipicolinate synthase
LFSGSIVAIVTPMLESGEIDYLAYDQLVDWHLRAKTNGIVVAGTTGESTALTFDEIENLTKRTLDRVNGQAKVIVGNGNVSLEKALGLTRRLNLLPIDGYLTVTPYYVKPNQAGLLQYFTEIANAAEHPIILYNVPGRTGCDLDNQSVLELAKHNNIVAIKDATGDIARAKELIASVGGQFTLLSGDDETAQSFMELGGHGVISVTANVAPELMARRCQLTIDNQIAKARDIDNRLNSLHQALFVDANPIPVKWLLADMSKIKNILRLPLTPLERGQSQLKAAIEDCAVKN